MSTKRQIILHIGTHKTGTTSLQAALGENRQALKKQGSEYYTGSFTPNNHTELFLSTIRENTTTFAGQKHNISNKHELYEKTKDELHTFISKSNSPTLIFSAEGMSYLRTEQECNALKNLFPSDITDFKVIVVLRDKNEFLESYRKMIEKHPNRKVSKNPNSGFYVENDTWLIDFEMLIKIYKKTFENIVIIPYQKTGLLDLVIKEMNLDLKLDDNTYRKNRSKKTHPFSIRKLFR
jgi:hypothetical protein